MPDVIVTTPQRFIKNARAEAERSRQLWEEEGQISEYFRPFSGGPGRWPKLTEGDRLYYVELGFVRGFGIIDRVEDREMGITCGTHGIEWPAGRYVFWPCDSWQWIRPIPMLGFQGFRYVRYTGSDEEHQAKKIALWAPSTLRPGCTDPFVIEELGDWLDAMPTEDMAQEPYRPTCLIWPDGRVEALGSVV